MQPLIGTDFLLKTPTARTLFHNYAKDMPIFDFHNHLSAQEIYERRRYANLTELWLGGDHYKWRAMRVCGIAEEFITGSAGPWEKFEKWAYTVERLPGNPLYHWTHLELQRYFGIAEPLNRQTAKMIWDKTCALLQNDGMDAMSLLAQQKVTALCTTNDPFEDLAWHFKIKEDGTCPFQVLPSFRPDKLLHCELPFFLPALKAMEEAYGVTIASIADLQEALLLSLARFAQAGCRTADHGYTSFVYQRAADDGQWEAILQKLLAGHNPTPEEAAVFKSELLYFLGKCYDESGFVMQLHLGAERNNNSRQFALLGPDTGFDSVGKATDPAALGRFLDDLAREDTLPNTVLYCLNPADNPVLATMAVNFAGNSTGMAGKVQLGAAWWFADTLRGMSRQLDEAMETGLLAAFVGMLTDSRSFTSFPRHEYFRRLLCDKLGQMIEEGGYENNLPQMGAIVQDICYHNAVRFFGLTL